MFIQSITETTSLGSFDHDQTKHVENGGRIREGEWPKDPKIRAYCKNKFLVQAWGDEEIQHFSRFRKSGFPHCLGLAQCIAPCVICTSLLIPGFVILVSSYFYFTFSLGLGSVCSIHQLKTNWLQLNLAMSIARAEYVLSCKFQSLATWKQHNKGYVWGDSDQDQWSKITLIMVHQRSRRIKSVQGCAMIRVISEITHPEPDHPKGTNSN